MRFTTLIDAASLEEMQAAAAGRRGALRVFDCRFDLSRPDAGRQAYRAAHIPGARYADLNHDLSSPVTATSGRHPLPDPEALVRFLALAGVGAAGVGATQVVAYDDANGSFAARAWWLLKWLGFEHVAVLDGGFAAWRERGGALESGEPATGGAASVEPLPAVVSSAMVASSAEVLASLSTVGRVLIDARAPERFAGSVEPLDAVAGHIPGARNHPFSGNLAATGRFLSAAELRQRWLERLSAAAPEHVIAMCGSGVTACHNLLAMAVAGLPGAQLYAGSWSEWIRDANRPVARGHEA